MIGFFSSVWVLITFVSLMLHLRYKNTIKLVNNLKKTIQDSSDNSLVKVYTLFNTIPTLYRNLL